MLMVTDIAAIAAITKPRNILLIVDNTVQLRNGLHPEYQSFQQQWNGADAAALLSAAS